MAIKTAEELRGDILAAVARIRESTDTAIAEALDVHGVSEESVAKVKLKVIEGRQFCETIRSALDGPHSLHVLTVIASAVSFFADRLQKIVERPRTGSSESQISHVNGFIQDTDRAVKELFAVAPMLSLPLLGHGAIDEHVRGLIEATEARLTAADDRMRGLIADAERKLDEIRKTASKAAAAHRANEFTADQRAHKDAAWRWLLVTAACVVVTLGSVVLMTWRDVPAAPPSSASAGQVIAFLTARLVPVSILLCAVVWASRTYRAHQHNEIVSRHRARTMAVYEVFLEGAKGDTARDAILAKAVDAAFAPQPTGFMPTGNDPAPHSVLVDLSKRT